ncbi:EamA family transporter [Natribaculum luteum]|uniref:EamA family transporter n=1 Tax=Natribaculum luteum TaxID=1586232 RepID=A0ABD5P3K1_9EURY|nr:EamA family transporter [Natribaculum luteum]
MGLIPDVYLFALLAALFWGASPVLTKSGIVRGGTSLQGSLVVVAVGTICYFASLAVLGDVTDLLSLSPIAVLVFTSSGAAGAVAWMASFTGVDRVGASINSAGFNTHPLFATVIALLFLGEAMSLQTTFGIVVIVVGLTVVATSKGGDKAGWDIAELVFPLSAAAAYAVSNVVRRYGLTRTSVTTLEAITVNAIATLAALLVYAAVARDRQLVPPVDALRPFIWSGLLSAFALFFLFEAFARGSVAIVSALSGLSPVVATVVSAVVLTDIERVTLGIATGVSLVVCGATLITLA